MRLRSRAPGKTARDPGAMPAQTCACGRRTRAPLAGAPRPTRALRPLGPDPGHRTRPDRSPSTGQQGTTDGENGSKAWSRRRSEHRTQACLLYTSPSPRD
eukprot:2275084-Alexandrium_andersonii.AAC.1